MKRKSILLMICVIMIIGLTGCAKEISRKAIVDNVTIVKTDYEDSM